jgi:hypothetical protein
MRDLVMRRCWLWVKDLVDRSFLTLLLRMENIESVLHLCELRSLSVNILPVSFDAMDCNLSCQDGLLFLPEPLNFLLDSGQILLFYCCLFSLGFFIPIKDLDLVKLCVPMEHLY